MDRGKEYDYIDHLEQPRGFWLWSRQDSKTVWVLKKNLNNPLLVADFFEYIILNIFEAQVNYGFKFVTPGFDKNNLMANIWDPFLI